MSKKIVVAAAMFLALLSFYFFISEASASEAAPKCDKSNMLNIGLNPVDPWKLNDGDRLYMLDKLTYVRMKQGGGSWREGCISSGTVVVASEGEKIAERVYACGNDLSDKYPIDVTSLSEVKKEAAAKPNLGLADSTVKKYEKEAKDDKFSFEKIDKKDLAYKVANCLSSAALGWGAKSGNGTVGGIGGATLVLNYYKKFDTVSVWDLAVTAGCSVAGSFFAQSSGDDGNSSSASAQPGQPNIGPGPDFGN